MAKAKCKKQEQQTKQLKKKYKAAKGRKKSAQKTFETALDAAIDQLLKKELKSEYKTFQKRKKEKEKAKKAYKAALHTLTKCQKKKAAQKKQAKSKQAELKADIVPIVASEQPKPSAPSFILHNGKKYKMDDLKIIEGIGPKIESLLHAASITTWLELSETAADEIRTILIAENPRYRIHDPTTWDLQAGLASESKWEELKKLQDDLKGGRIVE
ncbi:MAG: hypothetical protein AAF806_27945 [Bacteroidota bacterium]